MMRIYHNPNCSKSRGALEILRERGVACDIVEYLDTGLEPSQLREMIACIPDAPSELVRKDKNFKALELEHRCAALPRQQDGEGDHHQANKAHLSKE